MRIGPFIYDFRRVISPHYVETEKRIESPRIEEPSIGEIDAGSGSNMGDPRRDSYSRRGDTYKHKKKKVREKLDVEV